MEAVGKATLGVMVLPLGLVLTVMPLAATVYRWLYTLLVLQSTGGGTPRQLGAGAVALFDPPHCWHLPGSKTETEHRGNAICACSVCVSGRSGIQMVRRQVDGCGTHPTMGAPYVPEARRTCARAGVLVPLAQAVAVS